MSPTKFFAAAFLVIGMIMMGLVFVEYRSLTSDPVETAAVQSDITIDASSADAPDGGIDPDGIASTADGLIDFSNDAAVAGETMQAVPKFESSCEIRDGKKNCSVVRIEADAAGGASQ